jgi:hypothetical protein
MCLLVTRSVFLEDPRMLLLDRNCASGWLCFPFRRMNFFFAGMADAVVCLCHRPWRRSHS